MNYTNMTIWINEQLHIKENWFEMKIILDQILSLAIKTSAHLLKLLDVVCLYQDKLHTLAWVGILIFKNVSSTWLHAEKSFWFLMSKANVMSTA